MLQAFAQAHRNLLWGLLGLGGTYLTLWAALHVYLAFGGRTASRSS